MEAIIAAEKGWNVVYGYNNDSGDCNEIFCEPIIAWLCKTDEYDTDKVDKTIDITPITIEGTDYDYQVIQRPDKTFTIPWEQDLLTSKEVMDHFIKRNEKYEKMSARSGFKP
jgi:hypothetical protein